MDRSAAEAEILNLAVEIAAEGGVGDLIRLLLFVVGPAYENSVAEIRNGRLLLSLRHVQGMLH
jgi:hypothetical protein